MTLNTPIEDSRATEGEADHANNFFHVPGCAENLVPKSQTIFFISSVFFPLILSSSTANHANFLQRTSPRATVLCHLVTSKR